MPLGKQDLASLISPWRSSAPSSENGAVLDYRFVMTTPRRIAATRLLRRSGGTRLLERASQWLLRLSARCLGPRRQDASGCLDSRQAFPQYWPDHHRAAFWSAARSGRGRGRIGGREGVRCENPATQSLWPYPGHGHPEVPRKSVHSREE